MKIDQLVHGQKYTVRCGRRGDENVKWEPWQELALHIQREKKTGKVAIVGLIGKNWAEYGPDNYEARHGLFLVEDYYLQIEGLGDRTPEAAKHTLGPWLAKRMGDQWAVGTSEMLVANTIGGNDEANATLMAAAPSLLKAWLMLPVSTRSRVLADIDAADAAAIKATER